MTEPEGQPRALGPSEAAATRKGSPAGPLLHFPAHDSVSLISNAPAWGDSGVTGTAAGAGGERPGRIRAARALRLPLDQALAPTPSSRLAAGVSEVAATGKQREQELACTQPLQP
jgi:hypothetical protein